MHPVHQKAIKFIKSRRLIPTGSRVLAAFSGGPDSVFLLDFLQTYKKLFRIEIGALHLNHSIRGKEADADAQFCKEYCSRAGIELFSFRKNVPGFARKSKLSVEEAARNIRYNLLGKSAAKNNFNLIATAHNLEDNSETVFLNLIKGAGLNGLSGIPVIRGNIIRPLLGISKAEILDYLFIKNIPYRIDSSNDSVSYDRNFLRLIVLPQIRERFNPSLDETLLKTSETLAAYRNFIVNKIEPEIKSKFFITSKEKVIVKSAGGDEDERIIIGSILRQLVSQNFGISLSNERIKEVFSLFEKQKGKLIFLSDDLAASREAGNVSISKFSKIENLVQTIVPGKKVRVAGKSVLVKRLDSEKIKLNRSAQEEYIAFDTEPKEFKVRRWKAGDRFVPLGMKSAKKVSDFLTDLKLTLEERTTQALLEVDGEIAWVIGRRIGEKFKLNKNSRFHYYLRVSDE